MEVFPARWRYSIQVHFRQPMLKVDSYIEEVKHELVVSAVIS